MQQKRILNAIWVAMVGSIATYWVIHAAVGRLAPNGGTGSPVIGQVFILLSLITYSLAYWWFRWAVGGVAQRARPTELSRLTERERGVLQARLRLAVIACLSFLEVPVIYGLIHGLISAESPHLFEWLAASSLASMVLLRARGFPTVFGLLDRLEEPGRPFPHR